MVQSVDATADIPASKSRKKKSKKARRAELQPRSWVNRVVRATLAVAGLGLVLGAGAMLGRASARG